MYNVLTTYSQLEVIVKRYRRLERDDFDAYVVVKFQEQTRRTKVGSLHEPLHL
jgi:hypothetical protein